MSERKSFIQLTSFQGAKFNIDGKTKSYSIMKLLKLKDFLDTHLKYCAYIYRDLDYYQDYETKVDQYLTEQEEGMKQAQEHLKQGEEFEYSVSENFTKFLQTSNGIMLDNHQASKILKKEYTEKFGDNTLLFDAEMSYCYVYTKDREEAKQFLLFVYEKYIKSFLELWYDGFNEFATEFKNSTPEETQMFNNLIW